MSGKLLFVHIPKTAGQSVHKALNIRLQRHQPLFDRSVPQGAFVFSIVRNPYDRAVSLFHWFEQLHLQPAKKRNPSNAAMNLLARSCTGAREFWSRFATPEALQYQGRYTPMFRSQFYFLKAGPKSAELHSRVSRVLRFENLEEEWRDLAKGRKLGQLPKVNTSARAPWQDELDDAARQRVGEVWGDDFDIFGYSR